MSAWAKPGVKCVCVDTRPGPFGGSVPFVKDGVYLIEDINEFGNLKILGAPRVDNVWYWRLERFRPLITHTQSQDLEWFLPLLKTKELAE